MRVILSTCQTLNLLASSGTATGQQRQWKVFWTLNKDLQLSSQNLASRAHRRFVEKGRLYKDTVMKPMSYRIMDRR